MAITVENGLDLIEKKMFKKATLELKLALKRDSSAFEKIIKQFEQYLKSNKLEEALVLGKIALDQKPDNYQLANDLGNCARKNKEPKQAETFYTSSIEVKKDFDPAIYNLAACQMRIDKYDTEIEKIIQAYSKDDNFLLPDCFGIDEKNKDAVIKQILQKENDFLQREEFQIMMLKKEMSVQSEELEDFQIMMLKKEMSIQSGNPNEPESITKTKKELAENPELDDAVPKNVDLYLKETIKDKWNTLSDSEKVRLKNTVYYSGITALQNNDIEFAKFCFDRICATPYIDMLKAIVNYLTGKTREAFSTLEDVLNSTPENRYYNINLGLMYFKEENKLNAVKFLLKGAILLEKLDGMHKTSELKKAADESFKAESFEKALIYYESIKEENITESDWLNLSTIYFKKDCFEDACSASKRALKLNSSCSEAQKMLDAVHDRFFEAGEKEYEENNYLDAVINYEKALTAIRKSETLLKASRTYHHLNQTNSSFTLKSEYNQAMVQIEEEKKEKLWQEHLENGKASLQKKDINSAIKFFEAAMTLKVEKEAVNFLTKIYKKLNRSQALHKVTTRWNIEKRLQAKIAKQKVVK